MDEQDTSNLPTSKIGNYMYNNTVLLAQIVFSIFILSFTASMLYMGEPPSIYLPVMSATATYWMPSPLNHKLEQPSGIPQVKKLLLRKKDSNKEGENDVESEISVDIYEETNEEANDEANEETNEDYDITPTPNLNNLDNV
jgi:hypothetical protein